MMVLFLRTNWIVELSCDGSLCENSPENEVQLLTFKLKDAI